MEATIALARPHAAAAEADGADQRLAAAFRRLAGGDLDALEASWEEDGDDLYGLARWRTGSVSGMALDEALAVTLTNSATTPVTVLALAVPE